MAAKRFRKNRGIRLMIWCLICVIGFSGIGLIGISIAHRAVFSRADYNEYNTARFLQYGDINTQNYPREEIKISSGENMLTAYLYGTANTQGLIIASPGHRDPNDVKLYEITFFCQCRLDGALL